MTGCLPFSLTFSSHITSAPDYMLHAFVYARTCGICMLCACCLRMCEGLCVCVALVYDRWRLTSLWKKFDFSTPTSMSTGMRRLHHNRNCRRRLTLVAYCEIALSTGLLKIILFLRICFFVYQTSSRFNSLFFVLLENDKNKKELKGNLNILWHLWQ